MNSSLSLYGWANGGQRRTCQNHPAGAQPGSPTAGTRKLGVPSPGRGATGHHKGADIELGALLPWVVTTQPAWPVSPHPRRRREYLVRRGCMPGGLAVQGQSGCRELVPPKTPVLGDLSLPTGRMRRKLFFFFFLHMFLF